MTPRRPAIWAEGARVVHLHPDALRDAAVDLPALIEREQRDAVGLLGETLIEWYSAHPPVLPGEPTVLLPWTPGAPVPDGTFITCIARRAPSPITTPEESPDGR